MNEVDDGLFLLPTHAVQAQMEIFKLIQKDSFPPFLNSEQVG